MARPGWGRAGYIPGMSLFVDLVLPTAGLIAGLTVLARAWGYWRGVRRHARAHMGRRSPDCFSASSAHHAWEGPDLELALVRRVQAGGGLRLSYDPPFSCTDVRVIIEGNRGRIGDSYFLVPDGPDSAVRVPRNSLYLLRNEGEPICVAVLQNKEHGQATTVLLSVLALSEEMAGKAIESIVEDARAASRFRGKVTALEPPARVEDGFAVRFQPVALVSRDDIVLPETLLKVIERNTVGFLDATERLKGAGRSLRHGVLFHGSPGVGKTLLVRHLAGARAGHTVIILTGRNLQFIRESLYIARVLAPSVVVFEDIDLVAGERSSNHAAGVLHELLDELDGVGPRTPCLLLLTTNRPEVLEPALALRPGRVDQAIEFPIPDAACRSRLLDLYGRGLDLSEISIAAWVERLDGASPAFISELLRKATQMAFERGEKRTPPRLAEGDILSAQEELVAESDPLTRKLFGYRAPTAAAP